MQIGKIATLLMSVALVGMVMYSGKALKTNAIATIDTGSQLVGKSASNIKWAACDSAAVVYCKITSVAIDGTFERDSQIVVNVSCTPNLNFTVDNVHVLIKVGFITLMEDDFKMDIDGQVGQPVSVSLPFELFVDVPTGDYKAIARFMNKGSELQCAIISFKITG